MSESRSCPFCHFDGIVGEANFCQRCGKALRGPPCPSCHAETVPTDQFCTKCGGSLPAPKEETAKPGLPVALPWAIAGTLSVALVAFLALSGRGEGRSVTLAPPTAQPAAAPAGNPPDLSTMTPRQAADRLFNRVMRAVEAGNQAEADQFLPMAIGAYDRIPDLNLDDRFHLSLLWAAAGDGDMALAVAEAGLDERPTHLLDLAAAAEGAIMIGDEAKAREYYQRLVDVYDEESQSGLDEYQPGVHANMLPVLLQEAQAYLAGN